MRKLQICQTEIDMHEYWDIAINMNQVQFYWANGT